jgi:biopolymer transport protein ExbB
MTMLGRTLRGAIAALMIVAPALPALAQGGNSGVGGGAGAPQAPLSAAAPAPAAAAAVPLAVPQAAAPAAKSAALGPLHELSPWSMFMAADILVKLVMVSLMFASLVTWTILIAKSVQLAIAKRQLNAALARIADARSLREARSALGPADNVIGALVAAAAQEIQMSIESGGGEAGTKERAASRFADIVRMEARNARYGMSIIATIGATAPFVGLFGTVWGIMNSFIGISKAQTTNLAVVAPGIAEALLATAIGLAAAIPAVIIYNLFSRATKAYLELVARGSSATGRLLSRDLDRDHDRGNGRVVARVAG